MPTAWGSGWHSVADTRTSIDYFYGTVTSNPTVSLKLSESVHGTDYGTHVFWRWVTPAEGSYAVAEFPRGPKSCADVEIGTECNFMQWRIFPTYRKT